MAAKIEFTKMHGAGNDYIYVNTLKYPISNPEEVSKLWSDRHKGIGGDGLVLIGKGSEDADFSMRIFNNDGSEARMCGNASRCIGKYLYEYGLTTKTEVKLSTLSGIKILKLHVNGENHVDSVTVDMDTPYLAVPSQLAIPDGKMTEEEVVSTEGKSFVGADGSIRMRVWERGSGITMACGTGACATAVAAALTHRATRSSYIVMDGGTLHIEWNKSTSHVMMTGPATKVFDGVIDLPN